MIGFEDGRLKRHVTDSERQVVEDAAAGVHRGVLRALVGLLKL